MMARPYLHRWESTGQCCQNGNPKLRSSALFANPLKLNTRGEATLSSSSPISSSSSCHGLGLSHRAPLLRSLHLLQHSSCGWSSIQVVDGQSDCELWSLPPLVLSQSWRCSAVHLPHQLPADESSGSLLWLKERTTFTAEIIDFR
ncbi:unnamed protein product [Musa hybrid cultivar]